MQFRVYFRDKHHQGAACSYKHVEAYNQESAQLRVANILRDFPKLVEQDKLEIVGIYPETEEDLRDYLERRETASTWNMRD